MAMKFCAKEMGLDLLEDPNSISLKTGYPSSFSLKNGSTVTIERDFNSEDLDILFILGFEEICYDVVELSLRQMIDRSSTRVFVMWLREDHRFDARLRAETTVDVISRYRFRTLGIGDLTEDLRMTSTVALMQEGGYVC